MTRTKRWLLVVGGAAVVYGGANVILVGGHMLRHRDTPSRLDALAQRLDAERAEIEALEAELAAVERSLEGAEASIQQLGLRIRAVEVRYPDGVPSEHYTRYVADVEQYNGMIRGYNEGAAHYDRLGRQYSERVDTFNQLAEKVNALAAEIEDVPYLFPVDLSARIVSN